MFWTHLLFLSFPLFYGGIGFRPLLPGGGRRMGFTRFKEQNCRISSLFPVFHEEEEEEAALALLTSRVFPLVVVKQDPTTRDGGGGEKSKS